MSTITKPGWFVRSGHKYLTLSEVPRALNVTASEITDAVSRGALQIERVNGCKAVPLTELFSYIEKRGAAK